MQEEHVPTIIRLQQECVKQRVIGPPWAARLALHSLTRFRSGASSSVDGSFLRLLMGPLQRLMSLSALTLRLHARFPETHGW
jgi:hypothetical protein